ncbi:AMP-binding protein [Actinomadura sp. LD22]|uniref:AMP-binding protein n=1 Tax=Actinomadura physcomitrii TaxID=2650748 RepID=A0A6I4MBL3_9ACTN|nr:class I adenylate-forming enzyme family protein [Actinomadura physcomitrii]MWA01624.1 AMP-binding protein [Actinomadura physcomitrii]
MLRLELIQPVPHLLAEQAERFGDKVAFRDDRRSVGYADLERRTARLAGHLRSLGVARGDRVLIYMDDRVETAESYLATPRCGAVGVCVNPGAALPEIGYMLDNSGARAVITDGEHVEAVRALLAQRTATGAIPILVVTDDTPPAGTVSYERLMCSAPALPASDDLGLDDVAWMLYTSGTTGRPKGVLLTQRGCLWVVAACWAPIVGLSADDRVLCPLPLFHSYALVLCVLGVFAVGASERILGGFSPTRVLEELDDGPYTVLPGVPTMFQYLLNAAGDGPVRTGRLRLCVSAGAIMPGPLNEAFEQVFGVRLLEGYGITETSTMVTMNWPTGGRVMGSCGLPLPGVAVRLVDPMTGDDVEAGGEGELWVKGPLVMAGYHGRPEATAEALRHGWYRTGDLARCDANGFITISGRIKELIIRGGENIYPAEIELVLLDAPGVADAAVVGRLHPELGEVPVAFVVPERPGALDVSAAVAECRRRLSSFKVPERFVEVDHIPRTGSGKIQRHRLAEGLQPPAGGEQG